MFVIYLALLCCSMGVYGQQPQGNLQSDPSCLGNVVHELSLAITRKCFCYENNKNGLSSSYCVKKGGQTTVNMTSMKNLPSL